MSGSCLNKAAAYVIAFSCLMQFSSCMLGKKPSRRHVKIIVPAKPLAQGKRTLITVDTFMGKEPVTVNAPTTETLTLPTAEQKQLMAALLPLWQRAIDFKTFSGKAKMHFEGRGQKLPEFTAHFRISKDKIIWVNITAILGVNVARAYITPDSIFYVNYIQREAGAMKLSDAQKLLPVPADFNMLQNLVVGDVITRTGAPVNATDFGGTWTLEVESGGMTQQAAYNKSDSTMRSLQMLAHNNGPAGMMQYGNYEGIQGRRFANSRVVNITSNNDQYYLDMNFSDVEFDKELEFNFSIPKSYKMK